MVRSKKVKIQIEDNDGSKYSVIFEGNVDKNKILKVVELMELIGDNSQDTTIPINTNSTGERIWHLIDKYCITEFTSSKLLELYEDVYNEPIKLSVISTYLSRFANRNLLTRIKGKNEWVYRKSKSQYQIG